MLHRLTYGEGVAAPYVPVNCAAIPTEMFEAELFGAEKGAYTGADRQRVGLVGAADGGTLFLDEIGEVPLALQAKLLRFLEDREYRSLGSTASRPFGGRFVAATNKQLREEVKAGRFREDLFFRIEVFCIELSPLRRRQEDIPGMAEFLLEQLAVRYGRKTPQIKAEDLSALRGHAFPGNVRELRNLMERALLRTPEDGEWLLFNRDWLALADAEPAHAVPVSYRPAGASVVPAERSDLTPLEAQEYGLIRETLRETGGAIRKAAGKLGLSPQALLRRLEKWPELRVRSQD
jgi:transcriptional regulator with PAS, ATPase and Fis domain